MCSFVTCITDNYYCNHYYNYVHCISSSPKLLLFYSFCSMHTLTSSTGDSKAIFIKFEKLLSFKLLVEWVLISFIWEKLLLRLSWQGFIERQIAPILVKLGKRVFNMSLEASCDFITLLGLLTNNWLYIFHSVRGYDIFNFHAGSQVVFLIHSRCASYDVSTWHQTSWSLLLMVQFSRYSSWELHNYLRMH